MLKGVQNKCNDIHGEWKGIDYVAGKVMWGLDKLGYLSLISPAVFWEPLNQLATYVGWFPIIYFIIFIALVLIGIHAIWVERHRTELSIKEIKAINKDIREILNKKQIDNDKAVSSVLRLADLGQELEHDETLPIHTNSDVKEAYVYIDKLAFDHRIDDVDDQLRKKILLFRKCFGLYSAQRDSGGNVYRIETTEVFERLSKDEFQNMTAYLVKELKGLKVDVNTIMLF